MGHHFLYAHHGDSRSTVSAWVSLWETYALLLVSALTSLQLV